MRLPTPATRLIVLLGDPIGHSLSPRIQNAAFLATEVDAVYLALRCSAIELPGLLVGIARAGGAGNVTIPHKARAVDLLESSSAAVRRTGACNTFWVEDGRICGDNTDVQGFAAAVRALLGSAAGARVLILGAGGAARAALLSLLDARVDSVTLHNRSTEKAESLRLEFDSTGRRVRVLDEPGRLRNEGFDLVVNATSLGLQSGDPLPLDLTGLRRVGAALDLVYAPDETPWVRHARQLGVASTDGLEMLVQQAAAAFRHWWRREPPLDLMRSAAMGAGNRSRPPTQPVV